MSLLRLIRRLPPYTTALVIMAVAVVVSLAIDAHQTRDRNRDERDARIEAYVAAEVSHCRQSNEARRLVGEAAIQLAVSNAHTNAEALAALLPLSPETVEAYVTNIRLDAEAVVALFPQLDCEDIAAEARANARATEEG